MPEQATEDEDAPATKSNPGLSRDPADYAPTDHFVIRSQRCYGPISETRAAPPITGDVVETCITRGEVRSTGAESGRFELVADVHGREWRLVIQTKDVGPNLVLTAISDAHNPVMIDDHVVNSTGEVLPE